MKNLNSKIRFFCIDDTSLIKGITLDKEFVNPSMPKSIRDSTNLLLQSMLEIKKTKFDSKLHSTSLEQIQEYLDKLTIIIKK